MFLSGVAKPFRSIKSRVTLSVLAAMALSIALTTLVLMREAERATVIAERDRELREGASTASMLSRRVVELQRALAATAALLSEDTLSDKAKLASFIETKPVLRGLFSNVFAVASDGRMLVLAESEKLLYPNIAMGEREFFRQTVAEQRPIVSRPLPGRLSSEPVIIFTYPLRKGSRVYGVLGGTLRLESRDLLAGLVDDEDGGSLMVVTDSQGTVLAHPSHTRLMKSISTEPRMADGFAHWLAIGGASGGAVEPTGLFLRQPGQVLTVAGVAGPDWLVWRAVPESALLAPLHGARQKALVWAAAIVAGSSVAVLLLLTWLLRPLTLLKHRALQLFDDHNDVHAGWPEAEGEIGELARVLRHVGAERAQLEQFNAQVLARLGSVMAAAPVGIMFTRARVFELVSAEFCRLVGRSEQELLGQPAVSVFASIEDYEALGPVVGASFGAGQPYLGEWQFRRNDGGIFWAQLRGLPVESGNPEAGTIWTIADINELVANRANLEWSATHDPLTGLGNRKLFEQRAIKVIDGLPESLPAAIVMIDLDRFKPINDTAGHAAGDAMLRAVANAVNSCVRSTDLVVRLGGDEFCVLLENCPPESASRVAMSVHEAITGVELNWGGRQLRVGASLGVACLSAGTGSMGAWLNDADAACYEAKAAGRGVVRTAGARALREVGALSAEGA